VNWLAHLWLARGDDARMAGALLADFLRGGGEGLPAGVRDGIAHHRAVDRFTDAHPAFRRSRARLAGVLRLGRGVAVDLLYDHLLARDFRAWTGDELAGFARYAYAGVARHATALTPELRALLPRIAQEDWFGSYATVDGVRGALARMERRMRRPLPLRAAVDRFERDAEGFRADFAELFGELQCVALAAPDPMHSGTDRVEKGPLVSDTSQQSNARWTR
jgi:acyl carrier protein phosphodiesterase